MARTIETSSADFDDLKSLVLIREILGQHRLDNLNPNSNVRKPPQTRRSKNPDVFYLHPDHQTQTHVTPIVAALSTGWFREKLQRVGTALPDKPANQEAERRRLAAYIRSANRDSKTRCFRFDGNADEEQLHRQVEMDKIKYSVCVFMAL